MASRRFRRCLALAALSCVAILPRGWTAPMARRQLLPLGVLAVAPAAAQAEEEIPLGSIPKGLMATALGQKVSTPNGALAPTCQL